MRRKRPCRAALVLAVAVGALLIPSVPALGASQRGHVFDFSFGTRGEGAGQFTQPDGIAVDDKTGEVYVADSENNRVEEFEPEFSEKKELVGEKPTAAKFEVTDPEAVAVDNSTNEDPSKGDIYVVGITASEAKKGKIEQGGRFIYKFNREGRLIATIGAFAIPGISGTHEKLNAIRGVAVDKNGVLFVYETSGVIYRFNDAEVNEGESRIRPGIIPEVPDTEPGQPGLAVDSEDNVYVGAVGSDAAAAAKTDKPLEELVTEVQKEFEREKAITEQYPGRRFALVAKLDGETESLLSPALDDEDATAVAVNPAEANDAYLVNVGTNLLGEQASTVAAFNAGGSLIQRFGAPGLRYGDGVAVDSNGTVYVTDAASDDVDVFGLEPKGSPTVEGLSACTLSTSSESNCPETPNATTLQAQVDADGADTHYYFEYGAASCATVPSPCTKTSAVNIGEAFGDRTASVELPGLPPDTYHYRVIAENELGVVRSAEQTFVVLAVTDELPDGRQWELVSPSLAQAHGAEPEAITKEGGVIQAAEDGQAITYVADGPLSTEGQPEGSRSPEFTQALSARGADGWSTQDINTPSIVGSGVLTEEAPEYQAFSRNLSLALLDPGGTDKGTLAQPALSPPLPGEEGKQQERTIYLRDDAPLTAEAPEEASFEAAKKNGEKIYSPGYLPLATHSGDNELPDEFGGTSRIGNASEEGLEFAGATPDLSHVVFESLKKGTTNPAASALYEWNGATEPLQKVSVLPNGTLLPAGTSAFLGGAHGRVVRNAISENGAFVFWGAIEGEARHLYVRDTQTGETLQIDALQEGASGEGTPSAEFQAASAEGNRIFFTDAQRLTADSHALVGAPDLYVFELEPEGGMLSGTLTDLTPQAGADIVAGGESGGVLGTSEDGSYVYFVANGVLAPGASHGYCSHGLKEPRPLGTTCNLYVRHYNGHKWMRTRLVAALSSEDSPDWGDEEKGELRFMTSRVSPNGLYLAFMSDRSLTGYDNEDVTSKPGERTLDEEVYEYDAQNERLVCASCNPTGERPSGVFDTVVRPGEGEGGEGIGLLADRSQIWAATSEEPVDHWLAGSVPGWTTLTPEYAHYQSRYLSDDGRLFFNSPNDLVPAARSDKEKVYEYEPDGVGSCDDGGGCIGLLSSGTAKRESAFVDASASGNDVFFVTSAELLRDAEGGGGSEAGSPLKVYDAHACEPSSPCPPLPPQASKPCEDEERQCTSYSQEPAFLTPANTTLPGSSALGLVQVLPSTEAIKPKPTPKPLTRAQKLAKALKACKKDKRKRKRVACEAQARKAYGPPKHSTAKRTAQKGER